MDPIYDRIGQGYSALRKPDPRIAAQIHSALGDARSVVNVGAGAGSYEPFDRELVAVEPSTEMIFQRPPGSARVVQAMAEQLPFEDDSFDAAMCVLTLHHWADKAAGLREMRRVSRGRVVILTFDPAHQGNWLPDYLPELRVLDDAQMPPLSYYEEALGKVEVSPVAIPHDCIDGFLYAYWRRPEAYLDPHIRQGSSSFWALDNPDQGLGRLEADLANGAWTKRYGHLLELNEFDAGYRLVLAH